MRHFAQNDVDPSNVSAVSLTSLSDESSYTIASESLLSESEDDVSLNFMESFIHVLASVLLVLPLLWPLPSQF